MTSNKIRAAIATAALAPVIALGSGIATAAPAESPVPAQVADTSQPVQVEPVALAAPFTLGLSLLALPFCSFAIFPPAVLGCVVAV
ncbi:hypothetical protein [Nocardia abscessus]|uniref:hypothetical protein n=1 Tax=Nocardia abscessus TaxID=120957 RepID=UPI002457EDAE|nr:hypothetical protein [Nocardia abscessus]